VLLVATIAAFLWQARRVVAESAFKRGRTVIESALIAPDGRPMSTWQAAEAASASGSRALAAGDRTRAFALFAIASQTLDSPETSDTLRLFERAVKTDSSYSNAASRLGALLLMTGDYARARDVLRATLRNLEAYEIHERLGFACYFMGDADEARRHWNTCLERRPQNAAYYRGLVGALQP